MWYDNLLRAVLINPSRLKDRKYLVGLLGVLCVMVFISIKQGMKMEMPGDFTVFWFAGKNFFLHNDLYSGIGGARRYIYPPFAAMLFQVFALFPLKTAACLMTFVNLLLFFYAIYLTRSIFEYFIEDKKRINLALVMATVLSFRFFWYHFTFVQMNQLIFVLCLVGVLAMLKGKDTTAAICFVVATFIKVIPMFFLFWLVFRGNFKTYVKVLLTMAVCVLIPFLWRGFDMGMQDLRNYYTTFLEPFQQGRVEAEFHNHSLSSGIYKLSLPMTNEPGWDFNILNLTQEMAKKVYFYSMVILFGMFIACLGYLKLMKKPISFLEIALILLTTHLLSGITWEYHLVSLLYIYMSLLILAKDKQSLGSKVIIYFFYAIIFLNALVGKDTVGSNLYHYFGGYGALTWMMLLLFFYFWVETMFNNHYRQLKFEGQDLIR
ncbi:MAG: glycosyltransferase family 87 protein [Bacteroidota bacterium]